MTDQTITQDMPSMLFANGAHAEAEPPLSHERPTKPTDDELGDKLIGQWQGKYKFMYGAWHKYENGVWKPDNEAGLQFWQVLIDNKKNGIRPNAGKAASVEKYCQLRAIVKDDQIDAGHDYINLQNGVFNLATGKLEPHRPDLYMTTQLPFAFDEDAVCLTWIQFLHDVLVWPDGTPDPELMNLIQEAFYYSLTADTSYRVSFWLKGPSGTGKSTLVNVLVALAGNSHIPIDLDGLSNNPYQLAEVAGKRVVTFSEPENRSPLADGMYKRLVSKDPQLVRAPYGKPFSFVPICKVWGSMNDTPRNTDRSDAIYNRVIIIPMMHVIPEAKKDRRLDEKLLSELPGIFNWALIGGKRLNANGRFTVSKQSVEAGQEYKSENDVEALHISEAYERHPEAWVTVDAAYQTYRTWCTDNGYQPKSKITFGKDMKRLGMIAARTADGKHRIWKGLRPKVERKSEEIPF